METHYTTITEGDDDIPVVVEYEIDGLFSVSLLSVRPELFGPGADIRDTLSAEDVRAIEQQIVRAIKWRRPYGHDSHTGEPLYRRAG